MPVGPLGVVGSDSGGGALWWLLLLLLPLLIMPLLAQLNGRKRKRSELLEYGAPPSIETPPVAHRPPPPPAEAVDMPSPPVKTLGKPPAKVRGAAIEPPRAPVVTEITSKFRWGVDVGHYYWRGGGGASAPLNVGWGKKGATSSTPIVVNEMVTLEGGSGPAPLAPQLALSSKRESKRIVTRDASCRDSARGTAVEPDGSARMTRVSAAL